MTFEVMFTVSQPLNFLGYARSRLSQKDMPWLWSRDVEALFACDTSVDTVLSDIPHNVKEGIKQYRDPFVKEWQSIYVELLQFKERLERLWNSHCETVFTLMAELGFFYSGAIEVFCVMPFFREWPRSNPLSMPAISWTDKELLEFLVHEILHRTSEMPNPQSLWHCLSMVFVMKRVPKKRRFLIQHALIYVSAAWIVSRTLTQEFVIPHLRRIDTLIEECIEMDAFMQSMFTFFSSIKNPEVMKLAEEIVACCIHLPEDLQQEPE